MGASSSKARLIQLAPSSSDHAVQTVPLLTDADPALVYMIFAWLRVRYHPGHSASEGVLGRIVEVCTASSKVAQMARSGEKDAIVMWFEETYEYRDFDRAEFISMIVEKLEG